jgi:hypothetical protein
MAYIKEFLGKVKEELKANKPDRVDAFQKGATSFIKFVVSKFEEFEL